MAFILLTTVFILCDEPNSSAMWCFYDVDIATSLTQKVFLVVISKCIKISDVVDMNYIT
jgi:hypothetical protein